MVVGISGKKQSGKNTVAKIWQLLELYHNSQFIDFKKKHPIDVDWILKVISADIHKQSKWIEKSFADKLKEILCLLTGCYKWQLEDEDFKNTKLPEMWKVVRYRLQDRDGNFMTYWTFSEEEINIDYNHHLENYPELFIEQEEYLPTYREALQFIGTDLFRRYFHPDIWVNSLFADYRRIVTSGRIGPNADVEEEYYYPNWLITDCRFPNEADAIKSREGILIRVNRFKVGDVVYWTDPDDNQSSGKYEIFKLEYDSCWLSNGISESQVPYNEIKLITKDLHPSETALDDYDKFDYYINNNGTLEELILEVKEVMKINKILT